MGISLIMYGVGAIVLLGMIASVIKNFNAPKVEEEKTKQDEIDRQADAERRADRQKVIDARIAERDRRRQDRMNRRKRGLPDIPEDDDPKDDEVIK